SGQFDRLPPSAVEAEMCLLASMMLDKDMIGQVVQIVDREAFYQADHQIIFDIVVKLYEQNRPIDGVIVREELAKRQLLEEVGGAMVPLETVLHEVFEMIENRGQRGLETGFFDLDDMLNGLQNGEMVIVAARPSMGKTALAMNLIEGMAAERNTACAVFSLEM